MLAFNRAAPALRIILSKTFKLVATNFFDDFCQLELKPLRDPAWQTAETVMQLLGWKFSTGEDKRKPFSKQFEILGAVVTFHDKPACRIEVSNKDSRLAQLEAQVKELRDALQKTVPRSQLESLKGCMGFLSLSFHTTYDHLALSCT